MIFTLRTSFEFDAAHYLKDYKGKCANLHGHRWVVELEIKGSNLDEKGILWDFSNTKEIVEMLDHKCLNEVLKENPTAENISLFILNFLKNKNPELNFKVKVYESPKSSCEVES